MLKSLRSQAAAEQPRRFTPEYEEIAQLAYAYWAARDYPSASAEEDLFRAEVEVKSRRAAAHRVRQSG